MINLCRNPKYRVGDIVPSEYIPRDELITILKGDLILGVKLERCAKLSDYDGSAMIIHYKNQPNLGAILTLN